MKDTSQENTPSSTEAAVKTPNEIDSKENGSQCSVKDSPPSPEANPSEINSSDASPAPAPNTGEKKQDMANSYQWQNQYSILLKQAPTESKPYIPTYFRSSFIYIVLESELALKNKRRIVNLSGDDLLYASVTGKCVFIQIDWEKDFNNLIKVHESNHTWETTFSELIDTRPVALRNLFARSEVWAEGEYKPLSG